MLELAGGTGGNLIEPLDVAVHFPVHILKKPIHFVIRPFHDELNAPIGPLVMIVKSATIYETELGLMREVISAARRTDNKATRALG